MHSKNGGEADRNHKSCLRLCAHLQGRKKFPDSDFKVMTLIEACSYLEKLRQHVIAKYNKQRDFGIYVETKRPAWHKELLAMPNGIQSAKSMEEAYVDDIIASGFKGRVYVQSFEPDSLKEIKRLQDKKCPDAEWVYIRLLTSDFKGRQRNYPQERIEQLLPLPWKSEEITDLDSGETQVMYCNEYTQEGEAKLDAFFKEVATYADGIGPWKNDVLPNPGAQLERSPVIEMAHKHGLAVHPYTFRSDISMLPEMYMGNALEEYARFFQLGVDGVFTDFASHARHARHVLSAFGKDDHEMTKKTVLHSLEQLHPQLLAQQRVAHAEQEQR